MFYFTFLIVEPFEKRKKSVIYIVSKVLLSNDVRMDLCKTNDSYDAVLARPLRPGTLARSASKETSKAERRRMTAEA